MCNRKYTKLESILHNKGKVYFKIRVVGQIKVSQVKKTYNSGREGAMDIVFVELEGNQRCKV